MNVSLLRGLQAEERLLSAIPPLSDAMRIARHDHPCNLSYIPLHTPPDLPLQQLRMVHPELRNNYVWCTWNSRE